MITLGFNRNVGARVRRSHPRIEAFMRLCQHVAVFMDENGGRHFKAFFANDHGRIGLYLVTTAEAYDFELSRKLAEFAAPYIERGLLDSASLLPASSPEELEAFFDPRETFRVEIGHA